MNPNKRRKSITEKLRDVALGALCVLSVISAGIWSYWIFFPGSVDSLAEGYAQTRPAQLRQLLSESHQTYRSNPQAGLLQLQDILESVDEVRSRDAVADIKVRVFDRLSNVAMSTGQLDLAVATARDWVAFDPKDLNAKLRLSALLAESGNGGPESQELAAEVYNLVPEMDAAAARHSLSLLASNDPIGFWHVQLLSQSRAQQLRNNLVRERWTIFWDDGDGFSAAQSKTTLPVLSDDNQLTIQFSVPPGSQSIRLDPPPNLRFVLRDLKMDVASQGDAKRRYDVSHNSFKSRRMTRSGRDLLTGPALAVHAPTPNSDGSTIWADAPTLVQATNDPFFWWHTVPREQQAEVFFEAQILDVSEFLVDRLLEFQDPEWLELALRDRGFEVTADRLSDLSVQDPKKRRLENSPEPLP